MSIKIDTKALDKFADKLKKSENLGKTVCTEALNKLSAEGLRRVKQQTPRKTGNLARSWLATQGVTRDTNGAYKKEIYNTADYAVYVEYGHRTPNHRGWVPGQFMLTHAMEDLDKMKNSIIGEVVNKYIKDVFS